jgi:formylglycine-generating enzyme required for sulfatase activity
MEFHKNSLTLLTLLTIFPLQVQAAATIVNDVGMAFREIPAGEFTMGSTALDEIIIEQPDGKAAMVRDETPAHRVVFKQPFYLGITEVTQGQWQAVMGKDKQRGPDSHWSRKDWQQLPVVGVTWHDTQDFIERLNDSDAKYRYRLPTEAEWEYAARAGHSGMRPWPVEELPEFAWYIENSGDVIQPVATRKANAWGLHDLYGNVWEWTGDWYAPDYYANTPTVSPRGPGEGTKKVRRGGSFHCQVHLVRPGYRAADTPDTRYSVIGFRVVAEPRQK